MLVTDLTLKMTTAQVVETSVANNSLSQDYHHPDDHAKQCFNMFKIILQLATLESKKGLGPSV